MATVSMLTLGWTREQATRRERTMDEGIGGEGGGGCAPVPSLTSAWSRGFQWWIVFSAAACPAGGGGGSSWCGNASEQVETLLP